MIIFYLLALACALSVLVPSDYVSEYIKWPIALALVLLFTFFFNLSKKDTLYTTNPAKNALRKRGLYHPLMMYSAFTLYLTGFLGIYYVCDSLSITNIVEDYQILLANFDNVLICSLIIIGLSVLINNIFKWLLSKFADTTSLRERSILYIIVFLTTTVALIYNMISFDISAFNTFIGTEHNYFLFYSIPVIMLIIDFIVTIVTGVNNVKKKKGIVSPRKAAKIAKKEAKELERLNAEKAVRNRRVAKYEAEKAKDDAKFNAKMAKIDAKEAKAIAKEQAKYEKKIAKKAAKMAERDAKIRLKIAKVRTKNEKKADKLVEKYDRKIAKETREEMKKDERAAIKQAEIDGKIQKKIAKKEAKFEVEERKLQSELSDLINKNTK